MKEQAKALFLQAMEFRHACKEFDHTKKIPAEDFDYILQAMHLSPSSFGLEPWKMVVVQNTDVREQIKAHAWGGQNQIPTASHFVVIMQNVGESLRYDGELFEHYLFERRKLPPEIAEKYRGFVQQFQEDDFDLLSSQRQLDDWAVRQAYIPLAQMMLAAAIQGIDSCPMEGFNRREVSKVLATACDVDPEAYQPAVLLAFGYRKEPQPEKLRKPLSDTLQWVN